IAREGGQGCGGTGQERAQGSGGCGQEGGGPSRHRIRPGQEGPGVERCCGEGGDLRDRRRREVAGGGGHPEGQRALPARQGRRRPCLQLGQERGGESGRAGAGRLRRVRGGVRGGAGQDEGAGGKSWREGQSRRPAAARQGEGSLRDGQAAARQVGQGRRRAGQELSRGGEEGSRRGRAAGQRRVRGREEGVGGG